MSDKDLELDGDASQEVEIEISSDSVTDNSEELSAPGDLDLSLDGASDIGSVELSGDADISDLEEDGLDLSDAGDLSAEVSNDDLDLSSTEDDGLDLSLDAGED